MTYRTFIRSATCLRTLASARKVTVSRGLSEAEARADCDAYNDNRTARQVRRGTKLEYEREA